MNKNFKANERELVNVVTYFKRQSRKLVSEGKLGEEHLKIEETVDRFIEQINSHAELRTAILEQRKQLNSIVKDDVACPKCRTKDMVKLVGTEKNDKGWRSNRYKCRKCNIQFTWKAPNNPWDLIAYINDTLTSLQQKLDDNSSHEDKDAMRHSLENMNAQLEKITPVITAHDKEYAALMEREEEMEKLIHEFKNSLLIEKIKMDTWENKKKSQTR
jgi:DNA-directed RNA polymerase subunit RPC12/RpoP